MAITATAGSRPAADGYGLKGANGAQTAFIPLIVHQSDPTWCDKGNLFGRVGTQVTITNTTSDDVVTSVNVGQRFEDKTTIDKDPVTSGSEWRFEYTEDNGTLVPPTGTQIKGIGLPAPRLTVASFSVETVGGTELYDVNNNVHGFFFQEMPDQDSAVQSLIKPFEVTAFQDEASLPPAEGVITLFDQNMPCSAYLMKVLVSGNANAVGFRTLTRVSFPLVGTGSFA